MVGRADRHHVIGQRVQPLENGVDDPFQFPQFMPIVTELRDGVHFIEEEHRVACGDELENPPDVLGGLAQTRRDQLV